jgi:hypothetical protein
MYKSYLCQSLIYFFIILFETENFDLRISKSVSSITCFQFISYLELKINLKGIEKPQILKKGHKLTQVEVAKKLNTSQYAYYESGIQHIFYMNY